MSEEQKKTLLALGSNEETRAFVKNGGLRTAFEGKTHPADEQDRIVAFYMVENDFNHLGKNIERVDLERANKITARLDKEDQALRVAKEGMARA